MSDTDTTELKVVPIDPETAAVLEIRKVNQEKKWACPGRHKCIEVDEMNRSVRCRDCGFVLDAFDYVLSWANEGDRRMTAIKSMDIQRRVLNAECQDLQRKIKNLRQQLKRGGEPQPQVERDHFSRLRNNPHLKAIEELPE